MRPGLRVALLSWDMPPAPTGLGRAAHEIARALQAAGVSVTVFSADRAHRSVDDGLEIVGVAPPENGFLARTRLKPCRGHLAMPTAFARAVAAAGGTGAFDLVEATNWYAPGALVQREGLPLVVRCSTPAVDALDPEGDERHRRDMAFAHALERRTVMRADAVIYNTEPHRAAMRETYALPPGHEGEVIGLSLDAALVKRGRRAGYPESAKRPRLVFIGRAERRKGFDAMLQGFAALHRDGGAPPVLAIVGLSPGDLQRRAEALGIASEVLAHVEDHGRADDERVAALMEATHAVVAPSRYESYGLVYREAAAWGRPCVMCAEDPSARAFVRETGAGVLATACEGGAVARAVREALARAEELRAKGLAHVRSLGRDVLARRTLAVYERVARAGEGPTAGGAR